ncbi:MAG: 5-formyltetrahydrofolate cyclo-ligase [Clostridia bacterium]|nr:5-formyltetrahydrofolate cyclo-ligase [Clostridia bacterium]
MRIRCGGSSAAISAALRCLKSYAAAKRVMIYLPIKGEADVTELLADDKEFFVPVTRNGKILAAEYSDDTVEGEFGVRVPVNPQFAEPESIDAVIVPGVAFDEAKNRIGYGKGYYDAFLRNIRAVKIGAAFDCQIVDSLPVHAGDVGMDFVVCETRVLR